MENSSEVTFFILAAYGDLGKRKYFYFCVVLLLNLTIILTNITIISLIFVDRSLHEPMYVFLCNLFLNELYGSTALFPVLSLHILADTHEISRTFCVLQIFCLHTYGSIEFCNLAVMAYDRYLSICHPLHYSSRMTSCKVSSLVVFIWLFSFINFTVILSLQLRLPLCGNIIDNIFCGNYFLVQLSCVDTLLNNIYGLFASVLTVTVPLIPILYSYANILRICRKSPREAQVKALNTCVPQVLSILYFAVSGILQTAQRRFDMIHNPQASHVFSVCLLTCPQLLNSIMYGVRLARIREAFKNRFFPNSAV
ncbi:olfactory receptor 51L1-like [Anguilla anguilla]|uniref:olfactory receptor 51L1-like n=1 Tax=Anguilla anguilla TaxID=7936 RepID=UPI0015AC413E|nr:olfactory receptor 51L1-like [Anguilla anguilla]XP_035290716.1 olfactory receptor 51L1-like [Anguilla anguilla]